MSIKIFNQLSFSSILFDSLFGLILYFNLDSFLDITDAWHFCFYITCFIILIHWWLIFKSADDAFNLEVTNSALDLLFGIIDIILLAYIVQIAKTDTFSNAIYFLIGLFVLEIIWALIWRFIGKWRTKDQHVIKSMEKELESNIITDIIILPPLCALALLKSYIDENIFVVAIMLMYLGYIYLTFKFKLIDIKFF